MSAGECGLQQFLHLGVTAVAGHVEEAIVNRQTDRIGAAFEKECGDVDPVLPHGKMERGTVSILAAHERGVFFQQALDGIQVSRAGGAEHLPYLGARAGRPYQRLVFLERVGPDHGLALGEFQIARGAWSLRTSPTPLPGTSPPTSKATGNISQQWYFITHLVVLCEKR